MNSPVSAYIQLTKPTIMLLVLFTGSAALVMEGSFLSRPQDFLLVLVGLFLTGGAANALNQYFEREIDSRMKRTAARRPLPLAQISPTHALIFSIGIGVAGVLLFGLYFNWLTAFLSLATILFYSLYYTLWLKPRTDQNIVIGGVAGAMAPVGAWTAATGTMDIAPWILFLIIFLWTPPHFWALAMVCREDYRHVNLPMLPVVKDEKTTLNYILVYTIIVVLASFTLLKFGVGMLYGVAALVLGGLFLQRVWEARRDPSEKRLRKLFGYSIVYLFALFLAVIIDSVIAA